ncbi:MAG TPA: GIY-YIG nuclease family protein [Dehalococcoidales bacterium]
MNEYYVYIMSSESGVLYTGVTNDLARRVFEHKKKMIKGFTSRYKVSQLVYFESTPDIDVAIAREKQIKGWKRIRKVQLINSVNPEWRDLSLDFMDVE